MQGSGPKPVHLSTVVKEKRVRLSVGEMVCTDDIYDELLDLVCFYIDDPEVDDLDAAQADINEDLRMEFPGHSARVRNLGEGQARVVITGPRYNIRCIATSENVEAEDF